MSADLAFAGAARQAALIRNGETTSRALVELYLDRIARHDPVVNAYRIVFAERALEEADAADKRSGNGAGPLNGVPLAVKDDMDVSGEITAKGSIAHGNVKARVDAKIVRMLREAGAVILGKTNVPELMVVPFTETVWYGATRNPWDLDRTPGGSSGGSGAAVAAGLCAAATGSDGAGSIRIPSACCGLVGLKPAPGVVPTPPSWRGMSTYGFLARTAADVALLHDVVKTTDGSYADALADVPSGLKVAWSIKVPLGSRGRVDATMRGAVDSMVDTLGGLGHDVFRRDPDLGLSGAHVVPRYLRGVAEDARGLPDRSRLGHRTKGFARLGALIPDAVVDHADRAADGDRERLERIFDDADVLMMPLFTSMPPRIGDYEGLGALRTLDKEFAYTPFPALFNHTGLPAIAVPTEATRGGFPLAVQLVGPRGSEGRLLALAAQLEGAVGWADRRPPGFE
jgi:amidase